MKMMSAMSFSNGPLLNLVERAEQHALELIVQVLVLFAKEFFQVF